jgi:hypothetical protein
MNFPARPAVNVLATRTLKTSHRSRALREALLGGCAGVALLALPALVPLGVLLSTQAKAQTAPITGNDVVLTNDGYNGATSFSVGPGTTVANSANTFAIYGDATQTWTVANAGTIASTHTNPQTWDASIKLMAGGTVSNAASGRISGSYGISTNSGAVTVSNDGTIIGRYDGLTLGGTASVTNTGSISGGSIGVRLGGASSITNSGTSSQIYGRQIGIYSGSSLSLANSGQIISAGRGFYVRGAGSYIANTGTIIGNSANNGGSGYVGVNLDAAGTVTNSGLISGVSGIYSHDGFGTVVNSGTISGTNNGVHATTGLYLSNSGQILASGGIGVFVDGAVGTVVNSGYIFGAQTGVTLTDGTVVNRGTIVGATGVAFSNSFSNTLVNSGTIIGTGGIAVQFAAGGGNLLQLTSTGVFTGRVDGNNTYGGPANTMELLAGGTGTLSNFGASFTNFGILSVDTAAQWTFDATDAIGTGVTLLNSGTITGTVTLTGAGYVTNQAGAVIDGVGSNGIYASNPIGGILNAGTITAGNDGIFLNQGGSVSNSSTGRIFGGNYGIVVYNQPGTIANDGTIVGQNRGVYLYAGGAVGNTGLIQGGNVGVYLGNGGYVSNSGTIFSPITGIKANGGVGSTATVVNAGIITGSTGFGVYLDNGGTVVNLGSGQITGQIAGVYGAAQPVVVNNAGIITGQIGVLFADNQGSTSNNTLINSGTIIGTGGTAVRFGAGNDLLVLELGASFGGGVVDGGLGSNIVELDYDSTLAAIPFGTALINFGTVGAGAGVTLTNTGSFALAVGLLGSDALLVNQAAATLTGGVFSTVQSTVSNFGSIDGGASNIGVALYGGSLFNAAGGVITGSNAAVYVDGANGTVVNAGLLSSAAGVGLVAGNPQSLSTAITNSGVIVGYIAGVIAQAGSYAGSNTLTNSGAIRGTGSAGVGVVFNDGSSQTATLINSGTIVGASGTAVRFGAGNDVLVLQAGANFGGEIVDGGGGNNTVALSTSGTITDGQLAIPSAYAVHLHGFYSFGAGANATLTNVGSFGGSISLVGANAGLYNTVGATISGPTPHVGVVYASAAGVTVTNAGTIVAGAYNSVGVWLNAAGLVTNSGTISATGSNSSGVLVADGGATIVNAQGGQIAAAVSGVLMYGTAASTLVNDGAISSSGGDAVHAYNDTNIALTNSGTIAGSAFGVYSKGASLALTNSGTITGMGQDGVGFKYGIASITNSGSIGGGRDGVSFHGAALSLTNTNSGTISGVRYGVYTRDNNLNLANYGTVGIDNSGVITGGNIGVKAYGGSLTLENSGSIAGSRYGVSVNNLTATISNAATGQISGGNSGVYVAYAPGGQASVANQGTIEGTGSSSSGIYFHGYHALVSNAAGALISGANYGVKFQGGDSYSLSSTITNAGVIRGTGSAGVGIAFLDQNGTPNNTIINSGTIFGQSGTAVRFGAGNDLLVLQAGSVLTGLVDGGGGTNTVEFDYNGTLSGAGFANFQLFQAGAGDTLTNAGSLAAGVALAAGAALYNQLGAQIIAPGSVNAGVAGADVNVTVTNAGTISGVNNGVYLSQGGFVSNKGTASLITGAYAVGLLGTASVLNDGTITGSQTGIWVGTGANASIGNTGSIGGGNYGVDFRGVSGTLTNGGSISGGKYGVYVRDSGSVASVTNTGSISGGNEGVYAKNATLALTNGGGIYGGTFGVSAGNGGTASITNNGTITGVNSGVYARNAALYLTNNASIYSANNAIQFQNSSGTLTNTGALSGGNDGVLVRDGGYVTITNSGTIAGATYGVAVIDGSSVSLVNTARITGGNAGVYVRYGDGAVTNQGTILGTGANSAGVNLSGYGIRVSNAGGALISGGGFGVLSAGYRSSTITNAGVISGTGSAGVGIAFFDQGGVAGNTVINSGTIFGQSGTAVRFGAGNDLLVLQTGSSLGGGVADGGGGVNTVELDYSGTLSGAGFVNFQLFQAGAGDTLTNAGSLGAGVVLTAGAALYNQLGAQIIAPDGVNAGVAGSGAYVTVTNAGTITGVSYGVYLSQGGFISNAGTASLITGSEAIRLAGVATLQNAGMIVGSNIGVYAGNGGTAGITNNGTITGVNFGVYARNAALYLTNNASISSPNNAVQFRGSAGTLTNTGTISGGNYGVYVQRGSNVTITNSGAIADGNYGIGVENSTVTLSNSGTIAGATYGVTIFSNSTVSLVNASTGRITGGSAGVVVGYSYGTVINQGTILGTGTNSSGVYLSGGYGVQVSNVAGALISGAGFGVRFVDYTSSTITNAGVISGTGSAGVGIAFVDNNGTANNTVINSGTIIGQSGTAIRFGAGNDVLVLQAGANFGGEIVDGGAGNNTVALSTSGTITNGQLAIPSAYAVHLHGFYSFGAVANTTLTNVGGLNGSVSLLGANAGLYNTAGGVITSTARAGVYGTAANVTVTNAGTISSGHYGVYFYGTGDTLTNSGSIGGGNVGVMVRSGDVGVINNSGIITGLNAVEFLNSAGTLTNTGAISGAASGVYVRGDSATVTNQGTILGTGAYGAGLFFLNAGGSVSNAATGVISGVLYGIEARSRSNHTITNAGLISGTGAGGVGIAFIDSRSYVADTVINSGTIVGQSGTAIRFGAGNDLLVLQAGANFGGDVVDGGAGNNTVALSTSGTITNGQLAVPSAYAVTLINFNNFGAGANTTLTNVGSFAGSVSLVGTNATLYNAVGAQISTTQRYGVQGTAANVTVTNAGTIQANGIGVYLEQGGLITNLATGVIVGSQDGVHSYNGGTLVNSGLISGRTGVDMENYNSPGTISVITNSGTITGTRFGGLYATTANVTNSGLITGGNVGAAFAGSFANTLVNSGTIIGTGESGVGVTFRDNNGNEDVVRLNAPPLVLANNTLVNTGTIVGQSGTAVRFGAGNDLLILGPGAWFGGDVVDGGAGNNTVALSTSGTITNGQLAIPASYDVSLQSFYNFGAGANATLTNVGSLGGSVSLIGTGAALSNTAGATIYNAQTAVLGTAAGVLVTNAGTITSASASGVSLAAGGIVSNSGLISGYNAGVLLTGGSAAITNRGVIQATGTAGVGVLFTGTASGTIDNFGTIIGANGIGNSGTAVRFAGGTNELIIESGGMLSGLADGSAGSNTLLLEGTGTLSNAQILGFQSVVFASNGSTDTSTTVANAYIQPGNSFTNSGTFTGSVTVPGTATLSNAGIIDSSTPSTNGGSIANGGTITNTSTFSNTGSLTNSGTITTVGGTLTNSGAFTNTNSGTVTGDINGITGSGTIVNSGTITGTSNAGITSSGTVTNTASGLIQGGTYGIVVGDGGSVSNAGTIIDAGIAGASIGSNASFGNGAGGSVIGVTGVVFTGTGASFTNSGTITGTGTNGIAVQFDAGVNTLTLGTGSVLNGSIDGGTVSAGVIDLTGTGTMANAITRFGTGSALNVASGAYWTSTGDWTIGSVANAGTLVATGHWIVPSVTNAGTLQAGLPGATLNLTGNFTQTSAGTLRVALDAGGTGSQFNITGTAALAGSVAVVPSGRFLTASVTPYTILTAAGGLNNTTFGGGVTVSSVLLAPTLSYIDNDTKVVVTLTQLSMVPPPASPPVVSPPTSPPVVSPPTSPPVGVAADLAPGLAAGRVAADLAPDLAAGRVAADLAAGGLAADLAPGDRRDREPACRRRRVRGRPGVEPDRLRHRHPRAGSVPDRRRRDRVPDPSVGREPCQPVDHRAADRGILHRAILPAGRAGPAGRLRHRLGPDCDGGRRPSGTGAARWRHRRSRRQHRQALGRLDLGLWPGRPIVGRRQYPSAGRDHRRRRGRRRL